MTTKTETQVCPVCGSKMRFEKGDDVLTYKGKQKRIKSLGWWCSGCDEAIFDGKALVEREKAFLELKAEVDDVLGPKEVARVRGKLGLSQRRAGELLGGGPRAFQKYESGKQAVSLAMSHLLTLLENDPKRLQEIASGPSKAASPSAAKKKSGERRRSGKSRSSKSSAVSKAA